MEKGELLKVNFKYTLKICHLKPALMKKVHLNVLKVCFCVYFFKNAHADNM